MVSGGRISRIPQVSKALEIIENVWKMVGDLWVNTHQCKRVAVRFKAIGAELVLGFSGDDQSTSSAASKMDYPAFDELLTVVRKGQVLVGKNVQWEGIKGMLTWTDNREAFKEIHSELDTMKAKFPFEGISGRFETTTGEKRSKILIKDADNDLEAIKNLFQSITANDGQKPAPVDVDQVVKVVMEKSSRKDGDELPSFLQIELSSIAIKGEVRKLEILSKQVKEETKGWAIVYEGTWLGCEFAVKVYKSDQRLWNKRQLLKEVSRLTELNHPHIVRFIGFAQSEERCAVLMEMMPERDLRSFIIKKMKLGVGSRPFTPCQELDIITQIAKGMLYLHTQGYVHGDLKCSNILVKRYDDYIEVKIGDFRYAIKLGESSGGRCFSCEADEEGRRPRWSPPEALENYNGAKPTDELLMQTDVYSFAMVCYEVITGKLPFQDVRGAKLISQIKAGIRPELPDDLQHSRLKGLIEACWVENPNDRPVFENICRILDYIRSTMPAATEKSSGIPCVRERAQGERDELDSNSSMEIDPTSVWCGKHEVPDGGRGDDDHQVDALSTDVDSAIKVPEYSKIKVPEYLRINPTALKMVHEIGSGASAKVYEVVWLGCTFAGKTFRAGGSILGIQQELDFLIQLRHPYIIQMVGFSIDEKERCMIVMEYMKGSLRDLVDSRLKRLTTTSLLFEFQEAVVIITKLAKGMAFLHARGVTHRDLKAANVLCQEHSAGSIDVKIVDFGMSQVLAGGVNMEFGIGTRFWRAPEIFGTPANRAKQPDLKAADVYSFAMTCYEVLTGKVPFDEYKLGAKEYDRVVQGLRPTLPPDVDSGLTGLIIECWHADPVQRPNFAEICTRLNALPPC